MGFSVIVLVGLKGFLGKVDPFNIVEKMLRSIQSSKAFKGSQERRLLKIYDRSLEGTILFFFKPRMSPPKTPARLHTLGRSCRETVKG